MSETIKNPEQEVQGAEGVETSAGESLDLMTKEFMEGKFKEMGEQLKAAEERINSIEASLKEIGAETGDAERLRKELEELKTERELLVKALELL